MRINYNTYRGFLGNQFLKAGYKPQWVESGDYWIANGWHINLNDESRKLISESLSGGVGENNTIAMNTLKWTTSKVGRDLGILSDREESASLFLLIQRPEKEIVVIV